MFKPLRSIRWRLILIYLFITAAAFLVVTIFTTRIIERELLDQRVSE
jgi:cytochrome c oxidase subunit IV